MTLTWVVKAADNALDGDADAMRLLTGTLRVDGKRVAVPRIQLCSARISARLLPQAESLEAGEEMALNVVVVNAGLAAADVRVSCVLPEGISLVTEEQKESGAEEDEAEKEQSDEKTAVPLATDDSAKPQAEAVMAEHVPEEPEIRMENDTLVFDLHMDAPRSRMVRSMRIRGLSACVSVRMSRRRMCAKSCWARRWRGRRITGIRSSAKPLRCACIARWCWG